MHDVRSGSALIEFTGVTTGVESAEQPEQRGILTAVIAAFKFAAFILAGSVKSAVFLIGSEFIEPAGFSGIVAHEFESAEFGAEFSVFAFE